MQQMKFRILLASIALAFASSAHSKSLGAIWKSLKPGGQYCFQSSPITDYDSGRPTIENMSLRLSQSPATNHPNEYYAEILLNYSYISDHKHQYQKSIVLACDAQAPFECHSANLTGHFEVNQDQSVSLTALTIPESCDLKDENQVASCQKLLDVWYDAQTLKRLSLSGKTQWWPIANCK